MLKFATQVQVHVYTYSYRVHIQETAATEYCVRHPQWLHTRNQLDFLKPETIQRVHLVAIWTDSSTWAFCLFNAISFWLGYGGFDWRIFF